MVFDAPKMKGTFKQRLERIKKNFDKIHAADPKSDFLQLVEHVEVKSIEHMTEELDKVTGAGGEGVMIKDPNSNYENKRSDKLLKVKKFEDAEATVIGHQ